MTKIKIILNKIRIIEPGMLSWLLVPVVMLIVTTNYIFNSVKNVPLIEENSYVGDFNYLEKEQEIRKNNKNFVLSSKSQLVSILFLGSTKSQFEYAYPLIKQNGYVANISVPTADIGLIGSKMSWQNLLLLQNQGWSIVSQSKNQVCDLEKLKNIDTLTSETRGSKEELAKRGLYTNVYLAPCGIVNNLIAKEVQKYYLGGLITFGNSNNSRLTSPNYGLIAKTVTNQNFDILKQSLFNTNDTNGWTIIAIPEIGNGDGYELSLEKLNELLRFLKDRNVQLVTLEQVIKV